MLPLHTIIAYAIAAFLIVIVPGPNMTYIISCAATRSKKDAVMALLGSNAALLTLSIIATMGLSTIFKTIPVVYTIIKMAGALYLFWLAWKIIRSNEESKNADVAIVKKKQLFRSGYLTNVLNPKAAVFYIAIFPQFLNPHAGYILLQGITLGLIHATVSFIVNVGIIISVRTLTTHVKSNPKLQTFKKWGIASLFTAFGIRMLTQ